MRFIVYFLIGIISFFTYIGVYNSEFDLGIFCCVSTECFSVTKRVILYHWTVGFILLLLVTLLSRRYKAIDNSILPLILLMNLVNFNSICASHFYLILNLSTIIIACVFLNKKDINIKIMNMIIIIIIYIYTLYQLSEYFYYNKKYHTLENIIYTITSIAFFINVIISYTQNKNNVQAQ